MNFSEGTIMFKLHLFED